ncbi:hypothetical protein [Longibacter sp.]|uniref:hypothetical protein n=1 Tax=Longibacter sp. TaxID=2045415 RepID=UPI003EBF70EE
MNDPATQPDATTATTRSDIAQPVTPVAGTEIEARTAEFTWTSVPDATDYRLQIGPEADFTNPYFDAAVGKTTTLSVYDVLPEDGSTCYWRVHAITDDGATPWSGVAHFIASPDPVVEQANETARQATAANDTPVPAHPTEKAPVDGHSATFEWTPMPTTTGYEVEIAPTTDFDELVVNVPVRDTNVLTLYAMLPENGATFAWRVRGVRPDGSLTEWSSAASFVAATDQEVIDYEAELERKAEEEAEQEALKKAETAAERAEARSPVLTAQTSGTFAYTVAYLIILTFAATIYLIASVA